MEKTVKMNLAHHLIGVCEIDFGVIRDSFGRQTINIYKSNEKEDEK